jgi:hypothetical protein
MLVLSGKGRLEIKQRKRLDSDTWSQNNIFIIIIIIIIIIIAVSINVPQLTAGKSLLPLHIAIRSYWAIIYGYTQLLCY